VVDRQFILGEEEKEYFVKLMRQVEAFSGVRVLTYCVMSNHFHLLLEVPDGMELKDFSDEEFLARIRHLYRGEQAAAGITRRDIEWKLQHWREQGWDHPVDELKEQYLKRMYNLSEFMKTLKQRFTQWYNGRHQRRGTLWESRFKSVLTGGSWEALLTVAAYIDLNPARAGLVGDPGSYRWCGYAEAVGGKRLARRGLATILESEGESGHWTHVAAEYRKLLYGAGEKERRDQETGKIIKHGLDRKSVKKVLKAGGKLTAPQYLRCRARYFSDGFVIGTRTFVNHYFDRNRGLFGPKRKDGARKIRGANLPDFWSLRDLKVDAVRLE
jgi:REP element-mobilizing transposase RayT